MTNTTKYELKGFKIYHKDNKSKYDQLMKVMRTMKCKRKYKYDQLMKVIRSVMRTMKCKNSLYYFLTLILLYLKLIGSLNNS
jgi:hypothetical protein